MKGTDMTNHTDPLPSSMAAIVARTGGSIEQAESLVDATITAPSHPSGTDLLVRVNAISVNPVDTKVRAGLSSGDEVILGWDAVGDIAEVGPKVSTFHRGERVWYAGDITRPGSYAQYELVDERLVAHAPTHWDDASAAALPLTGLTAWEALFDKLKLQHDSSGTLLVIGAAGGVGSMIIQLAKHLTNLTVIALASRPQSKEWAANLGADSVVDYHSPDLAQHIHTLAPDGVDYAFSAYSKAYIPLLVEVMRPFGEIVAIDDEHHLDWYALKDKALSWHWEFMFARAKHHAHDLARQHDILENLAKLADEGLLLSTMTQHLSPISANTLRQAHRMVESGHMNGKVTITR
jgi:zinc-binding alcohol dehydrogenase family protein